MNATSSAFYTQTLFYSRTTNRTKVHITMYGNQGSTHKSIYVHEL